MCVCMFVCGGGWLDGVCVCVCVCVGVCVCGWMGVFADKHVKYCCVFRHCGVCVGVCVYLCIWVCIGVGVCSCMVCASGCV